MGRAMSDTDRDATDALKAHVRAIVDDWPPLTAEQKTIIWHAIAPMRAAITKRKRASPSEGDTDAAA